MLKKILVFALTAVLLTGCAGMNLPDLSSLERPVTETAETEEATGETDEPDGTAKSAEGIPVEKAGEKAYKTALEYVEANLKSPALTALSENTGDLVKLEIEGTENSIIYKYILADDYPFDLSTGAAIDTVLLQAAPKFLTLAEEIAKEVDQEDIDITVIYYHKGSSVVTREF